MAKTPTNDGNRDDRVEAVADALEIVNDEISQSLTCAEGAETDAEIDLNLDDAIEACERLLKLLKGARS